MQTETDNKNSPSVKTGYNAAGLIADIVLLALYAVFLFFLSRYCRFGGAAFHLKILLPVLILLIILFAIKILILRKKTKGSFTKTGAVIFLIISIFFGSRIAYFATPYNGHLAWKLDEFLKHKRIKLVHNNIFDGGIEGILSDMDAKLNLPSELYLSDNFVLDFDNNGDIKKIDAYLYGKDGSGKVKSFLINYIADKSDMMDVWLYGEAGDDFDEDKLFAPAAEMLKKSDYSKKLKNLYSDEDTFEIIYYGKRKIETVMDLNYIDGDVDFDGNIGDISAISKIINSGGELYLSSGEYDIVPLSKVLNSGGELYAYKMSLSVIRSDDIAPISNITYIAEAEYKSQEEVDYEHVKEIYEEAAAENAEEQFFDNSDGSVYIFLKDNKNIGFRLIVTDSALGSRYYELEKTDDGAETWKNINKDPFMGRTGSAEGIKFFTDEYGFIGLQDASGDCSKIYMTKDGGGTFTEIVLPIDEVESIPEQGTVYGYTIKDYSYMRMPELENDRLKITLTAGEYEDEGIDFYSDDEGNSWYNQ